MAEMTNAKYSTRPILTSPLPERMAAKGNTEADRTDSEAILSRIRDHLPQHLAPIPKPSPTPDSISNNSLPAWKQNALDAMPSFNSRPLDKIHTALGRVTPGKRQKLVEGPRAWSSDTSG